VNSFALRRYEAGLSLVDAAEKAKVGRTTLSRLENGHTERPSVDVARKLAKTYGISVAQLLGVDKPKAAA
jgi:transcriptional regulator with XRE-family HTH domain